MNRPLKMFFSYSHRHEDYRFGLETHLAALNREGIVETRYDRRIGAGKDYEREISEDLESADVSSKSEADDRAPSPLETNGPAAPERGRPHIQEASKCPTCPAIT